MPRNNEKLLEKFKDVVARITILFPFRPYLGKLLRQVEVNSTFCNNFLQPETKIFMRDELEKRIAMQVTTTLNLTLKIVARQVERICFSYYRT